MSARAGRTPTPATVAAVATAALLLASALTGCVPGETAPPTTAAPTSTPEDGDSHVLDGATAATPDCQPASAAVVAAVNASMTAPDYNPTGVPLVVDALVVTPDPAHAVWLLTGVVDGAPGSDGYLVTWATTVDPTDPDFDGALRSVGYTTAALSSAPALQFADGSVTGGPPPAALACAPGGSGRDDR